MVISKSQIKVQIGDEKPYFECQVIVDRGLKLNQQGQKVLLLVKEGKNYVEHEIDDYLEEEFYEILDDIMDEGHNASLKERLEFVLYFLESRKATEFIDVEKHSKYEDFSYIINTRKKERIEIRIYGLSADLIVEEVKKR